MSGIFHRVYEGFISPHEPAKTDDALLFGLLGASAIAPMALIIPAKSHPEVIVACIAARDKVKAEAYAKKHGIPIVLDSYEEVINEPSINCVYIPLPNSHHYEWALRAIKAGKHVLLEKPSTSNAEEARGLFENPLVTAPNAPVLLEAFHNVFHPAWRKFLQLIHDDPLAGPVKSVFSQSFLWKGVMGKDDIRFKYSLSGGCAMDFGTYNICHIRQMLGDNQPSVQSTEFRLMTKDKSLVGREEDLEQIDEAVKASYKSKTGAEGRILADITTSGKWPLLPASWKLPVMGWPKCVAELGEKEIDDSKLGEGEKHFVQRTVTTYNHMMPIIWHSIVVEDKHQIRREAQTVRSWTKKETIKEYDWSDKSDGRKGAVTWSTYRYQLEEFVNRVKGRKGSGVWFSGEESIGQMIVLEETYKKGGLKPRPTRKFEVEV